MAKSPRRKAGSRTDAPPAVVGGILARLQNSRSGLGPTSRRIADFILNRPDDVVHMSITEVAEHAQASEGSVIGLCQQLGTTGFQQLKIALAQEIVQPIRFIHEDLERTDGVEAVVKKIFHSDITALQDTLSILDPGAVEQAVQIVLAAARIEVYGIGSAAPVAEDAHYRLLRIGLNCKVVVDSHVQAISAALTDPSVAVITISHSGATQETVTSTRLAKEAGAKTICITNFGKSPIQAYADVVLYTAARETRFPTEAMTSRIAQLCIVDALVACLALANYDTAVETIRQTSDILASKRF